MYNITQFSKLIGKSVKTLQRWDRENILKPSFRTPTNRRMYSEEQHLNYINKTLIINRKNIIYCRVSSIGQKNDLKTQKDYIIDFTRNNGISIDDIYEDIGSGLNFNRKKFNILLNEIMSNKINTIVIAHKDRLVRFGYEIFKCICDKYNVKILTINDERLSPQEELCKDLTSIIHVFSSRLYGLRRYKNICKNLEKNDI